MKRLVASALMSFAALAGEPQPLPLQKEGGAWVSKIQGTAPAAAKMKIGAQGRMTVRAEDRKDIRYTWVRRVWAPTEAEARERLQNSEAKSKTGPGWTALMTETPAGMSSEIEIAVPRTSAMLFLSTDRGKLSAYGLTGEVQVEVGAGDVDMDAISGSVTARTGGGTCTFGRISGALRCLSGGGSIRVRSAGSEAVLETAGGEIYVEQAGGPLRLSTEGNIHVGMAAHTVSAHTTGGLIEIYKSEGMVTAESGGGSIQIGTARGLRAESAGGTIRMESISGSVRASTASGNIWMGVSGDGLSEDSFVATGGGDITVFLPSNLAVTVKALNETGGWAPKVVSEFPEIKVLGVEAGRGRPVVAEGMLNGGGRVLLLSATRGAIFVKKRK